MTVNVVSFSSTGGAGNSARTLVSGFNRIGVEARLITAIEGNLRNSPAFNPLLTTRAVFDAHAIKKKIGIHLSP